MTRVLVTGAGGFVGHALMRHLIVQGFRVTGTVRENAGEHTIAIGDLGDYEGWQPLLVGVSVVVHLAARAHVLYERSSDPLSEFRRVNVGATLKLARAAAAAGVRRFVFLSSIGVNGVSSGSGEFAESDQPHPTEPYAISKWEAEQGLLEIAGTTEMQIVRIRPPLILGPGVKGNLRRLMQLVDRGLPLPFGAIANHRSFVALEDLCDLVTLCIVDDQAANELFLAADPEHISTPELLRRMALALDRRCFLIRIPLPVLALISRLLGARQLVERMASSLRINGARARTILQWTPRTGIGAGITAMARDYRQSAERR